MAMKYIIIVLLLMLAIPVYAETETGIVVNSSGYVLYKSAAGRPSLQEGEIFVPYEDINSVEAGAKYDGAVFVNPEPLEEFEEIELTVRKSPIDPTQTIISGLTGAGAAYLMVRRKKTA